MERQREDCERIVQAQGRQIAGLYDDTESASDHAGAFEAINCWDLDHHTRQSRQWIEVAEDCILRLVTANGKADLSTDGVRLYTRVKATVARGEIERKGSRKSSARNTGSLPKAPGSPTTRSRARPSPKRPNS